MVYIIIKLWACNYINCENLDDFVFRALNLFMIVKQACFDFPPTKLNNWIG